MHLIHNILHMYILLNNIIYIGVCLNTRPTTPLLIYIYIYCCIWVYNNIIKTFQPEDHKFDDRPTNERPPKEFREIYYRYIYATPRARGGRKQNETKKRSFLFPSVWISSFRLLKKRERVHPLPVPGKDVFLFFSMCVYTIYTLSLLYLVLSDL